MRNTLGFLFVGALLTSAASLVGCGGNTTNSNNDDGGTTPPDLATAAVNPCGTASLCTLSTIADQSLALFDNGQTTFTVTGAPDYAGNVNATIDRSSIDSLPGGKDPSVGLVVLPGNFDMVAGVPKRLDLRFNTTTDAAAFDGKTITIHVADSKDATKSFDIPFKLTVRPELTISYTGAGATGDLHAWSTDSLADPLTIPVRQRPVTGTGAQTKGGTTFIFMNKDKNKHEIHADSPLTHQNNPGYNVAPNPTTNQPSTPANGGVYQLNNINAAGQNGGFYCHDHQTFNAMNGTRKLNFIP